MIFWMNNIEIDSYLWDIITMDNTKLFKQGINLIILEVPNDDVTGNVKLICPTNQYSKNMFDEEKV